MKGQMIFEFMVAAVIFIGIVLYIIMYMSGSIGSFSSEAHSNFLETKAVQISELLVKSPGVWDDGVPVQPGLALDWPVLDPVKVGDFQAYCQDEGNTDDLQEKLGLVERGAFFDRTYSTRIAGAGVDCSTGTFSPEEPQGAYIRRYAVLDGETVALDVWVW